MTIPFYFLRKGNLFLKEKIEIFKANKYLGQQKVAICISLLSFFVLFFIINYIFNFIKNIGNIFTNGLNNGYISLINIFKFDVNDYIVYIIIFIICFIISVNMYFKLRVAFKDYNKDQKGSDRFTTIEEIKQQYKEIEEKKAVFNGTGGIPIYQTNGKIYIDTESVNTLIIGATRSGKGELFVVKTIDIYSRAKEQASLIITDPKLELYKMSYKTLKDRGYIVKVLNLIDPINSMGYNPLTEITRQYKMGNIDNAQLLCNTYAHTIVQNGDNKNSKDPFWDETAKALINALILSHIHDNLELQKMHNEKNEKKFNELKEKYNNLSDNIKESIEKEIEKNKNNKKFSLLNLIAIPPRFQFEKSDEFEKNINMYSIVTTFQMLLEPSKINPDKKLIDDYFYIRSETDISKQQWKIISAAGSETMGSITTNVMAKLKIFTLSKLAKLTLESTVSLEDIGFGDKPTAIFLGIPDQDTSNHFLISVFIKQLYFTLVEKCAKAKNSKCKREVIFLLDEFGNIPTIDGMSNLVTVGLGRNIKFIPIVQDLQQIKKNYGDDYNTIVGNCGNLIYIKSASSETNKYIIENLGSYTMTNISRSGHKLSLNKTYTESYDKRELLSITELIRELKSGEFILLRTMKTKNNKNEDITPYPIHGKMLYRYQYLTEYFPNVQDINYDVHYENREKSLDEYILDLSNEDLFKDIFTLFGLVYNEEINDELYNEEEQQPILMSSTNININWLYAYLNEEKCESIEYLDTYKEILLDMYESKKISDEFFNDKLQEIENIEKKEDVDFYEIFKQNETDIFI